MDISVVVPLFNEEESLPELHAWITRVMNEHGFSFEVVYVDDGSNDGSWKWIEETAQSDEHIRGVRFRRNYGKSAALHTAFEEVKGDVVITMDADLQDSPDEIPELYKMIVEQGYDLVSGWKKKRYDPISKTLPSKLYNFTASKVTGIKLHDFNCGLKAYRKKVVKSIEVYGEMHRYIPYIAKQAGFTQIGEKVVQHRARKYGKTKFGMSRFIYGYLDLMSIYFISRFGKRPMHLFGTIGTFMFVIGFLASLWLGGYKLYCVANSIHADKVTESPYFYLALSFMLMGTQLFLAGFLGELVSRSASERNVYLIETRTDMEGKES
ncbi:glycosyltransferase family 2 protein [Prolixibacter sp. SD074]|jgi:glycosyltransferase involved in cell wall biosynthesis|uniref:glycosyltransferase family 2 protein n=1 Tax=Prolixibacter sp. SD074 TaxID=2652391 RepID=UPI0012857FCD|nr:glycosyltransferase family 2 protein [Prolixibacter sp. SD074]GET29625.1 glycosyl transferase [Prolixibacter sp. SD074]